jgi:uncharacterized oligopeptide transporter (OPT) family protein
MRTIINKILMKIAESVDTQGNAISSVRLQSYIILFPILMMVLVFLIIEIWSFAHAIQHGDEYKLSSEIIIVFGMMLSHHLAILFSRSKSQTIGELKGGGSNAPAADVPAVEAPVEEVVDVPSEDDGKKKD